MYKFLKAVLLFILVSTICVFIYSKFQPTIDAKSSKNIGYPTLQTKNL